MPEHKHKEIHITVTESQLEMNLGLVSLLSEASELSHQCIKTALDKGCVWLGRNSNTRRIRRVKTQLKADDLLHCYYDELILNESVEPCVLIADEQAYSIWFKPYGVYSQGSKWGDHCTITRSVEKQTQRNAFLIHRLDRATQGLMVIAHKKTTAAQLAKLFSERAVLKRYQAVVHGLYPTTDKPKRIDLAIDGKASVSHVQCLSHNEQRSLVEVRIETGRKHQIRRHLAESGFPIVGDRLHGIDQKAENEDLKLCCTELSFKCPITGEKKHYHINERLRPKL